MNAVVQVRGLSVDYRAGRGIRRAVDDVDLEIAEGEAWGLVGPSGSGKSSLALALTRCLPRGAAMTARQLVVAGSDLLTLRGESLRRYRRDDIGVVFQEPGRALNPTATIGAQVGETRVARGSGRRAAATAAIRALAEVGLDEPEETARRYPHELSGGQQQRAMIAMALAGSPRLVILDEPTTALDAVAQTEILMLLDRLRAAYGFASLMISHDRQLVAAHCDRISLLQEGRLREMAAAQLAPSTGVRERAALALDSSTATPQAPVVVEASGLAKSYGSRLVLAGIDLRIARGETLAVVGESGSGKTTLGRVIAGLTPHEGHLAIRAPSSPPPVQMVFQSPDASLNPRRTVRQTLGRSIRLLRGEWSVEELAHRTGIPDELLDRLPAGLSGGQKQRVAIARAFAGRSAVIICDEPTTALDAQLRVTILDLIVRLQEQSGAACLYISHDLSAVRRIAHRIAVLRDGRIVETGPSATLLDRAQHPYTRRLVAAAGQ